VRAVRFRRWFLPASMITLGVGAVAFLGILELDDEILGWPEAPPSEASSDVADPVDAVATAVEPRRARPERPGRALAPRPAPLKERPPPPHVRETPQVVSASGYLTQLARAKTHLERLAIVDGLAATLPDERAAEVLTGLVDSVLPGTFHESEDLRLLTLARLGDLSAVGAEQTLVARLDPEQPRPQRVMAIEMLASRAASRPDEVRAGLEAIARGDHDLIVQEKARWALQRQVN